MASSYCRGELLADNGLAPARRSAAGVVRFVDLSAAAVLVVASLALYLRTLAPDVAGADTGEFQFVPYVLGIAHPPGYPLYTMLGKAFTLLPVGTIAYRMNLMSAFFGALTVALVYLAIARSISWGYRGIDRSTVATLGGRLAAVCGASALAVSATWWCQSTVAAVRTLNGFFVALCLLLAITWASSGERRWLKWLAVAFGLSLTHHISMWMLGPAFLLFVLVVDWRAVAELRVLLSLAWRFVAPLALLLYLPIRSAMGTPFDPAKPTTIESFLSLVLARGFAGDMFHYGLADMPQRLDLFQQLLVAQFGWIGLALALVGVLGALSARATRYAVLLLVGVGASNAVVSITYRAPVIADYLIPSYVTIAICLALGVWALGYWLDRWLARLVPLGWGLSIGGTAAVGLISLILPWQTLTANFSSLDMSGYREVRQFVESALRAAAPGSTILADWHDSTALWYGQLAEGLGREVNVVYVSPQGDKDPWADQAAMYLSRGPVYVTDYHRNVATAYRLRPAGPLLQVLTGPGYSEPAASSSEGSAGEYVGVGANLDGKAMLLGYRLEADEVTPGEQVKVTLFWKALDRTERPCTAFVHLTGADGRPWGQHDGYPGKGYRVTTDWQPGEIVADEHELVVWPDTPPGRYEIVAGLYESPAPGQWRRLTVMGGDNAGADAVTLRQVTVASRSDARVAPQFGCDHEFDGWVKLRGLDVYRWSESSLSVGLYWSAVRATQSDLSVVLTFFDSNGTQVGRQVSQPMAGAYPTSRWQPGEMILDRHDVSLAGPPSGDLRLRVEIGNATGESAGGTNVVLTIPRALNDPGKARVNFGNKALLTGWSVQPRVAQPGDEIRVTLNWEPLGGLMEDCSVFVHVIGSDGQMRGQHDGVPVNGGYPTLRWVRGREVRDTHIVKIDENTPPGEYELQVGAYVMRNGERWPVLDRTLAEKGQGDRILLGSVTVKR